jgi:hypothetical protein
MSEIFNTPQELAEALRLKLNDAIKIPHTIKITGTGNICALMIHPGRDTSQYFGAVWIKFLKETKEITMSGPGGTFTHSLEHPDSIRMIFDTESNFSLVEQINSCFG